MGKKDNARLIKGFIGLTVLTPIAGAAIGGLGAIGGQAAGIGRATQSLVAGGLALHAGKAFGLFGSSKRKK